MRKITQQAIEACMNHHSFKSGNTQVTIEGAYVRYYLHGNNIAWKFCEDAKDQAIRITNCGWFSTTTKERLNGIPGVSISQRKGVWYLNGKEWDGTWTTI